MSYVAHELIWLRAWLLGLLIAMLGRLGWLLRSSGILGRCASLTKLPRTTVVLVAHPRVCRAAMALVAQLVLGATAKCVATIVTLALIAGARWVGLVVLAIRAAASACGERDAGQSKQHARAARMTQSTLGTALQKIDQS